MRNFVAAVSLLFTTSAMAATFTYTPVHTAPVVHVNPVVRVNPAVKPNIKPVGQTVSHSHKKPAPVTVYTVSQNQKCQDRKSPSTECSKK
jgi:hypothetical protein